MFFYNLVCAIFEKWHIRGFKRTPTIFSLTGYNEINTTIEKISVEELAFVVAMDLHLAYISNNARFARVLYKWIFSLD